MISLEKGYFEVVQRLKVREQIKNNLFLLSVCIRYDMIKFSSAVMVSLYNSK